MSNRSCAGGLIGDTVNWNHNHETQMESNSARLLADDDYVRFLLLVSDRAFWVIANMPKSGQRIASLLKARDWFRSSFNSLTEWIKRIRQPPLLFMRPADWKPIDLECSFIYICIRNSEAYWWGHFSTNIRWKVTFLVEAKTGPVMTK